jgi:hypothetical protein
MSELEQNPIIEQKTWSKINEGVNSQYDFQKTTFGGTQTGVVASNLALYDAVVDWEGHGDFVDIQSAIDAGFKKIFIRSGTYDLATPIVIDEPNIQLIGEDNSISGTQITSTTLTNDSLIKFTGTFANSYGFSIDNIYFDGNVLGGNNGILWYLSDGGTGAGVADNFQLTIKNCRFGSFYTGSAIKVIDSYLTANIHDNFFKLCLNCIYSFLDDYGYGFWHSRIHNNTAYLNAGNSFFVKLDDLNYYTQISNNTMIVAAVGVTGIQVGKTGAALFRDMNINGNIFTNYYGYATLSGIVLNAVTDSNISNNVISYPARNGISMTNCEHNDVVGNLVEVPSLNNANLYCGILLSGTSIYNTVTGNTIDGIADEKYGISEEAATSDYNIITSNNLFGSSPSLNISGVNTEVGHNRED